MFCAKCGNKLLDNPNGGMLACCGVGYLHSEKPLASDGWWPVSKTHGLYFYPNHKWNFNWKVSEPNEYREGNQG